MNTSENMDTNVNTNTKNTAKRRYTKFTDELRTQVRSRLQNGDSYKDVVNSLKVSLPRIYEVKRELGMVRKYAKKTVVSAPSVAPAASPVETIEKVESPS